MGAQAASSIGLGLFISAVLFVPVVVWEYRRFTGLNYRRLFWLVAGFGYLAALIALAIFPAPTLTDTDCELYRTHPMLNPFRLLIALVEVIRVSGIQGAASSWLVHEASFNIAMFLPFGLILRQLTGWSRGTIVLAALGTSGLIELTQLTGNWGIAPCSYRFADVTDLFTNTTGAAIGVGLEWIAPRLLAGPRQLMTEHGAARAVSHSRRLLGMFLDAGYVFYAGVLGSTTVWALYLGVTGGPRAVLSTTQLVFLRSLVIVGAWLGAMAVVVVPALFGNGASLGQRTVYLAPRAPADSRVRLVVRVLVVQGVIVTLACLGSWKFPVLAWTVSAMTLALVDTRGLSGILTGCTFADARRATARRAKAARDVQE